MIQGFFAFFKRSFVGLLGIGVNGAEQEEGGHGCEPPRLSPAAEQQVWIDVRFGIEQAGYITYHDHDDVAPNAQHELVLRKIVTSHIQEECFMIIYTDLGGSQESVCRKDDTGDDADVEPLAVGTRAEEPQQKDTGDAAGEDRVEREDDAEDAIRTGVDIEHGDADADLPCHDDDVFPCAEIMTIRLSRSQFAIVVFHAYRAKRVKVGAHAADGGRGHRREDEAYEACG